jgi:hypothetical protein
VMTTLPFDIGRDDDDDSHDDEYDKCVIVWGLWTNAPTPGNWQQWHHHKA